MNILLIDKDEETKQSLSGLIKLKKDWNLIEALDFNDGLSKYKNFDIDFVIVDFSFDENLKLLN